MKLIFEKSKHGIKNDMLPPLDVPEVELPTMLQRKQALNLPEVAQPDITRHYSALAKRTHGANDGFYPLGSCTMKYNPKLNDEMASLPNFTKIHPLQPVETVQGALEVFALAEKYLCEITGMDKMTFQPAAGAHGELTGLMIIKAYHTAKKDFKRNKIIVPDSAHGTNPASASMVGYKTVNVPSDENGCVDPEELRKVVGDDTAGIMLTNPNTLGKYEENISEVTKIVHDAGGLNYYDGANLNAVMGVVRPGDMGFDVIHLNLHKTFSTPHGGGGPGSGPIGVKNILEPFLPNDHPVQETSGKFNLMKPEQSIGRVKGFYGHFLVDVRALTYILYLGAEGIPHAAKTAVLNANYLMEGLKEFYKVGYPGICMHEFVLSLKDIKKETGVTALDVAKMILDYDMYPPTMYFPTIVPEALMIEPTETESKETLDEVIRIYGEIHETIYSDPEKVKSAPHRMVVKRLDEVKAARQPKLAYQFD
ncbi:aminomethyl-transferring glycine dehydrogenase subunit GcvPB [Vagococcus elongatus]|uniref:Probable glycine dehydrogenase (decarboxylating) subunit 2 n=1 Tax=Vagococcus elongatus TaxID=180344 RepID=A0A430AX67_9ENTE|nr:aminomethyl-transferring glycine dehydrogenase subunit GcvPB [Vagococcus elongatus]RSU12648.1 glycine dehydrogenase (aminomethyl-transferring) [Vagococcus elongatus]